MPFCTSHYLSCYLKIIMLKEKLAHLQIVLGSQSPRRKHLLTELGVDYISRVISTDESFDPQLNRSEIAVYLAQKKGNAHRGKIANNELIITADTIVCYGDKTLNKPQNFEEAKAMLQMLSGQTHQVYTGVCFTTIEKQHTFYEKTDVTFHKLSETEIEQYIRTAQPFDKAGSYGIQEWMGYAGIQRIEGDFFNVMGLPLQKLYRELIAFVV